MDACISITVVLYKCLFKIAYSDALPAQPPSNRMVLRVEKKDMEWSHGVTTWVLA